MDVGRGGEEQEGDEDRGRERKRNEKMGRKEVKSVGEAA